MFFQRYCWGLVYIRAKRSREEHRSYSLVTLQSRRGHKSTWKIADVETEVELILARASIFNFPENISQLTICPYNCSSLGIGWRSGSHGVRFLGIYPTIVTNENGREEREASGKSGSNFVYQKTGVFVPVGSGMHR